RASLSAGHRVARAARGAGGRRFSPAAADANAATGGAVSSDHASAERLGKRTCRIAIATAAGLSLAGVERRRRGGFPLRAGNRSGVFAAVGSDSREDLALLAGASDESGGTRGPGRQAGARLADHLAPVAGAGSGLRDYHASRSAPEPIVPRFGC